ncbi:MarR family transcriptional regulator [Bifidobacterium sp. SO4]|uniref:MarR family winged helix-turn-helix transcriptional regulator n=1 Tax=Bifidobacterium sp. SO4 TaxID=2809030 RepID=UPI001BDBBA37|nr:MarR family transcriptional regulator [Bifidobacterium sp. SO4]MBT1170362.1 MarR family transcriptional regulator [Bifidobacterium sp. SO4]
MLDNELHFLLLRAFNHSNRRIDAAIRRIGLLPGQPKILECLNEQDGRTAKEICAECILDKSTMTGLLTRMEHKGLVRREASESDRRSYLVFLTDEGRDCAGRVAEIMAAADTTATDGMNDEERQSLREGLRCIIANLERADARERAGQAASNTEPHHDEVLHTAAGSEA